MKISALTDIGLVRKINEDSYAVGKADGANAMLILADGMGGHKAGKLASSKACECIKSYLTENYEINKQYTDFDMEQILKKSIIYANDVIYKSSSDNSDLNGMGTTCVVCIVRDDNLYIANVGDSRLYLIDAKNKNINQITVDHSYVQTLVEQKLITKDMAATHPQKNIITRAVGTEFWVDVDCFKVQNADGKRVLMCSDGLTNMVCDSKLLKMSLECDDIDVLAKNYIDEANKAGGRDNITVIIAEIL